MKSGFSSFIYGSSEQKNDTESDDSDSEQSQTAEENTHAVSVQMYDLFYNLLKYFYFSFKASVFRC